MTSNPKILLVDDDPNIRWIVLEELAFRGFIVDGVENTLQAFGKLRDHDYDLLLLDLSLSDGSGTDVLKFICDHNIQCRIIVLTGACALDAAESIELGASDYVCKPFDIEYLVASINSVLQQREVILL